MKEDLLVMRRIGGGRGLQMDRWVEFVDCGGRQLYLPFLYLWMGSDEGWLGTLEKAAPVLGSWHFSNGRQHVFLVGDNRDEFWEELAAFGYYVKDAYHYANTERSVEGICYYIDCPGGKPLFAQGNEDWPFFLACLKRYLQGNEQEE